MIVPREPDDDESAEDPSAPDRCSRLDEYWDALAKDEAAAARQRLIEQDQPGASIAMDLDVLDKLHRARYLKHERGETSGFPTAWLAGFLTTDGHSRRVGSAALTEHSGTADQVAVDQSQRIGKYIVVELLESGGQAEVFRVIHPGMATELALKLARRPMAAEEQGGRDPLLNEGRLLVDCKHPNLVQIIDVDVHEGRRFVVMEYVKGLTLQQFVARQRPGPRKAARLVIELAGAVAYLHDRGIVHQDIKPQNVLIDQQGRPRLIDLGLARKNHAWCDDANDRIGGTAGYMSPEQAMGSAHLIGPRTDVFGLGGLLYHLLTGRALYFGASFASLLMLAREAGYVPIRELNPRAPRSLARICHKALARYPEARYPTADALGRDLKRSLQRRWVAATALVAMVPFMAAGLFMLRPRSETVASELAPGGASPSSLPASSPLTVLTFWAEHSRERDGRETLELGRIDRSGKSIYEGDGITLKCRLDKPAYCYVIALTADGKFRLCRASEENDLPSLAAKINPEESAFPLADGPGLQAFVILASRQQLPAFKDWKGGAVISEHWRHVEADGVQGVWEYKDGDVEPISSGPRSATEKRDRSGTSPFRKTCENLAKLKEFDVVRGVAFRVRPRSSTKENESTEEKK